MEVIRKRKPVQGRVISCDNSQGVGSIRVNEHLTVAVPYSAILGEGIKALEYDDLLEFEIVQTADGPTAERVIKLYEPPKGIYPEKMDLQPASEDLELVGTGLEVYHYTIPHIVIRSERSGSKKKPLFLLNGEQLKVEEFAKRVFEGNGYQAFLGEDANFFFAVLSFNFEHSFFLTTYETVVGAEAERILPELKAAVSKCLLESRLSEDLFNKAAYAALKYYVLPPKNESHRRFDRAIRRFDREAVLRVIRLHRETGYKYAGAPDLFIAKGSQFWFVEVKSINDSLSADQYSFFEGFIRTVGNNIAVVRVL